MLLFIRFIVGKTKPSWLRFRIEKFVFSSKLFLWDKFFDNVPLKFAPRIKLKLVATDTGHKELAFKGYYEHELTQKVILLSRQDDIKVMVDVGANCGYYSCLWAGLSAKNSTYALEASPRNLKMLKYNVANNSLDTRVKIFSLAAGNKDGIMNFNCGPDDQTGLGGFMIEKTSATVDVPVVKLDSFATRESIQNIDILKIDTEGADFWVLQGAAGLLRGRRVRNIFYEECFSRMPELGIMPKEAEKFLISLGYKVEKICESEIADEYYASI